MARDKEGSDIQFSRTDSSNIARNCSRVEIYSKCCFERFVVAIEISRDHFVSSISRNDFFGVIRDVIREGSRIRVVDGRTKRRDGWTDGWMDVRAKVRTKRSGLSSCLQPRHSSSVCRPRGGMNAFHYDSYLLPDLSTLSAPLLSSLLSFSHGRRFDRISSRSRRIRRRSGERERNVIVDRKHSPLYT